MHKPFLQGLFLMVCVVSLAFHISAQGVGMLDSTWGHGNQAQSLDSHGEEDFFVLVLSQDDHQLDNFHFKVKDAFVGGYSIFTGPQPPPPKLI
jgi:hypothetical protein